MYLLTNVSRAFSDTTEACRGGTDEQQCRSDTWQQYQQRQCWTIATTIPQCKQCSSSSCSPGCWLWGRRGARLGVAATDEAHTGAASDCQWTACISQGSQRELSQYGKCWGRGKREGIPPRNIYLRQGHLKRSEHIYLFRRRIRIEFYSPHIIDMFASLW